MAFSVPDGFRVLEAQEFCASVVDGTHDSPKETQHGKRLVTSKHIKQGRIDIDGAYFISEADFNDINKRSRVDQWDVIFTMIGTVGEVALVTGQSPDFAIKNVGLFKSKCELRGRWLSYFLRSRDAVAELEHRKKGSTQQYVSLGDLRTFPVLFPSNEGLARDVVDTLAALDDRIDLLRQTNTTLEAIAQALFKSWFVDFDPVRAKAEGREPEGMDAATAALFPCSLEEWQRNFVGQHVQSLVNTKILAIGDGYRAKNSELGIPGVAFLRAGDLLGGRIFPTRDLLSEGALPSAKGKHAQAEDTVFTSKGTIGRFAFVPALNETVIYSPQVCYWRSLDHDIVMPEYLHFWMRSPLFSRQVDRVRGNAAIMDFVSLGDQRAMTLDLPSSPIQKRFAEIVRPLLDKLAVNRVESDTLADLRDTLLPRLISGKLRLPEAETTIEEALA